MKKVLLAGLAVLSTTVQFAPQTAVAAPLKPYCSVASNSGYAWHTFTRPSHQSACHVAFFKVLGAGRSVDRAWKGYYKSGLNKAKLSCNQGSRTVYGNNKQVFVNAINMASQLRWSGCLIRVL